MPTKDPRSQETDSPSFGSSATRTPPDDETALADTVSGLQSSDEGTPWGALLVSTEQPGRYCEPSRPTGQTELGRGGMGRVLAVHDQHLNRDIAVKELLGHRHPASSTRAPSSEPSVHVARFVREARLTGQLAHPNIVPVYELGSRSDGTLYYTMKLVQGTTMADRLGHCQTLQERMRLLPQFLDLCHAIAYAHSQGVVHRDIKPHNVMLGDYGETVVLDWGLAKARSRPDMPGDSESGAPADVGDVGHMTEMGTRLGTPYYMSPEQARGQVSDVDERSDVWSLGVVLFEILTGHRPFQGRSAQELTRQVCSGEHRHPRGFDEGISAELSAICEKALQPESSARYQNAGLLAHDVESFITGGRVAAYEYNSWELQVIVILAGRQSDTGSRRERRCALST